MLAALLVQAVDHELRPIAGQDFLFGGLFLAAVHPFFFLRSFCRQFLILRRDDGRLISLGSAVQTVDNELRTIARQDFLLGGLSMTAVDFFFSLRPLGGPARVVRWRQADSGPAQQRAWEPQS